MVWKNYEKCVNCGDEEEEDFMCITSSSEGTFMFCCEKCQEEWDEKQIQKSADNSKEK